MIRGIAPFTKLEFFSKRDFILLHDEYFYHIYTYEIKFIVRRIRSRKFAGIYMREKGRKSFHAITS